MALNTQKAMVLQTLGPFLGIDNTTVQTQVPPNHAIDCANVVPDRVYMTYCTARGRSLFQGTSPSTALLGNIFKNLNSTATNYLAYGTNGALFYFTKTANPITITTLTPGTIGASFAAYHQWIFFTNGNGANTLMMLANAPGTFTNWGVVAPATPPTAAPGAAGNLTGIYQYVVTFGSATVESSPSPIADPVTVVAQQINLTAIPVSVDPQVTQRNIYRVGGALADFLLVATINDNTTTTYTDNLKDIKVTGQNLVQHRDPAIPFTDIVTYQDRVWGLGNITGVLGGSPSDVWYSNFAEPWAFDNTNQVIPVGRNSSGDNIVGGCALGSMLMVFKQKTTWAILGDDQNNFLPQQLFTVGCTSKLTIQTAYGLAFWLSDQGVWSFDGSSLNNISDGLNNTGSSIKSILDQYPIGALQHATAFIYDRFYCLSFPTIGVTWMYFLPTQQWYRLAWSTNSVAYDLDNSNEVTAARVTQIGFTLTPQGIVDSWFAAETDLQQPINSFYTSGQGGQDSTMSQKRYSHVELVAPIQSGSYATVQVIVDPGPLQKTFTQTWNLSYGPLRRMISMPPNMLGFFSQIKVSVVSSAETQITSVNIYGYPKRILVQKA